MTNSDTCCGFGGSFSVGYPDISLALVDDKIDSLLPTGAETVVGCDVSCLMQIRGRLTRRGETIRVLHLAQVLDGGGAA
jgi:L-lactate dehydrogenase complex protein LldE